MTRIEQINKRYAAAKRALLDTWEASRPPLLSDRFVLWAIDRSHDLERIDKIRQREIFG